jgi:hypothetical protein
MLHQRLETAIWVALVRIHVFKLSTSLTGVYLLAKTKVSSTNLIWIFREELSSSMTAPHQFGLQLYRALPPGRP